MEKTNCPDDQSQIIDYYVLFHSHENGLLLHDAIKKAGLKAQISPTPRRASVSCGISLLLKEDIREQVWDLIKKNNIEVIDIVELPRQINPNRDKYC